MRHRDQVGRTLVLAMAMTVAGAVVLPAGGLDPLDSPDTENAALDLGELYAFEAGDATVFVLTVSHFLEAGEPTIGAGLSPSGLYQFHLDTERDGIADAVIQVAALGPAGEQIIDVRGPVRPDSTGVLSIVAEGPSLRGPFNTILVGEEVTAFVGPRDDPLFGDLLGDRSLTSVLNATFTAALGRTIGDLAEQSREFAEPGEDDLAGRNAIAIVVEVSKTLLADALRIPLGGAFHVWATASDRR